MGTIKKEKIYILGAGIAGLAAGFKSGYTIFEQSNIPGGACSSYYAGIDENKFYKNTRNSNAQSYRFEIGGRWIFGADKKLFGFIRRFVKTGNYLRRASVYFAGSRSYVPYPMQDNLRYLDKKTSDRALNEIIGRKKMAFSTMSEWLMQKFGPTLCNLFFYPFHKLYTANNYRHIAPQDYQKTPSAIPLIVRGSRGESKPVGYNAEFIYPAGGLNKLIGGIAAYSTIRYNKKAVKIDLKNKRLHFGDGTFQDYDRLISTLPLNEMLGICGIDLKEKGDPYTSILVLNIGALKGGRCPNEHWLYTPDSISGFFRIGFYSNVDETFLPKKYRKSKSRVSIYVERSYGGGRKPSDREIEYYKRSVIKELKAWGFIKNVEFLDSAWIDVAYTWRMPGSTWVERALSLLRRNDIYQIGRYGRWHFQGIAQSIADGLNWEKYA